MVGYKKLLVLAAAGVLGFSTQAAAQKCTKTALDPFCAGTLVSTNLLEAVLMKVTLKDLAPTNPGPQSLSVQACDSTAPFPESAMVEILRTASPKDIVRCHTLSGSPLGCTTTISSKPASTTSDSVLVTLSGGFGGALSGFFEIRGPGWEQMKVQVLAATGGASVTFGGAANCP